jgi:hypothetical protein
MVNKEISPYTCEIFKRKVSHNLFQPKSSLISMDMSWVLIQSINDST